MNRHLSNLLLFICLSFTVAVVTALGFAGQQPLQLSNLSDGELKELVISLERTTCYGNCPAYKVAVYGDGRVQYEGKKNVKQMATQEGRLQPADLRKILSAFDKAGYFSIKQYTEESCSCTLCTDMPTTITEIRAKGVTHRVEHYYGCRCAPKELWELEKSLDVIVGTEQWIGDVSKQGPLGTTCFNK